MDMKKINIIFMTIILIAAFYVMLKDLGDYSTKPAGAGEIWWTQVPQIDKFYQNLNKR
jgi:hypothetical protein